MEKLMDKVNLIGGRNCGDIVGGVWSAVVFICRIVGAERSGLVEWMESGSEAKKE